jgi:hypothetical protein
MMITFNPPRAIVSAAATTDGPEPTTKASKVSLPILRLSFHLTYQRGDDFVQITDDPQGGDLEDWRVWIGVYIGS